MVMPANRLRASKISVRKLVHRCPKAAAPPQYGRQAFDESKYKVPSVRTTKIFTSTMLTQVI